MGAAAAGTTTIESNRLSMVVVCVGSICNIIGARALAAGFGDGASRAGVAMEPSRFPSGV